MKKKLLPYRFVENIDFNLSRFKHHSQTFPQIDIARLQCLRNSNNIGSIKLHLNNHPFDCHDKTITSCLYLGKHYC